MRTRRIDAHLHLWDLSVSEYAWLGPQHGKIHASFGPAEAGRELASSGIDGAILVQAENSTADTQYLLDIAGQMPWVLGVVGWVNLDEPETTAQQLDSWQESPWFCGVRHLVHIDPRADFLDRASVRSSLRILAERAIPFDVPDAWPGHLGQVDALARDLPGLTIVVDHLAKPPRGASDFSAWRDALARVAAHENTVAKVSGLQVGGQPFTAEALESVWEIALDLFGAERLMWGSDWPMTLPFGGYAPIWTVLSELIQRLGPLEQSAIFANTATRIYSLDGSRKV
jgi:L-fuconolactonase